jgi:hypothetical protein
MKQKNTYIKKDFLLFIYLFFHFFQIIIAASAYCPGCKLVDKKCTHANPLNPTCDPICYPDIPVNKCQECPNMKSTSYYYFSNGCYSGCNGVIIYQTKQCISNCNSFGFLTMAGTDFCFTTSDCVEKKNKEKVSSTECKCVGTYTLINENGKYYKQCHKKGDFCTSKELEYNHDTMRCGVCGGNVIRYLKRPGLSNIKRCSDRCIGNEKNYNGYCMDKCPEKTFTYNSPSGVQCVDDCPKDYFIRGSDCITPCNDYKYDNRSCINNCPNSFLKTHTISYGKFCSHECKYTGTYNYIDGSTCVSSCSSNYYKSINGRNICYPSSSCYVRYDDNNSPHYCYSSCKESGYPYYIGRTCYLNCASSSNLYHKDGEFECLSDCSSSLYYKIGYICHCLLYGFNLFTKTCYTSETNCLNAGFKFKKGHECLRVCNPYFEAEEDVSGDYLKNCFTSIEECRSHNYYYYNTHMLKCWNICPYYSTQIGIDGKPQEDFSRSTCVVTCGNDFPKYTSGTKICKKQCDNGEFYRFRITQAGNLCAYYSGTIPSTSISAFCGIYIVS